MQAATQAARALLDGVAKKGHVPQLTAEHPADERGFPPAPAVLAPCLPSPQPTAGEAGQGARVPWLLLTRRSGECIFGRTEPLGPSTSPADDPGTQKSPTSAQCRHQGAGDLVRAALHTRGVTRTGWGIPGKKRGAAFAHPAKAPRPPLTFVVFL